jgi:hypothetical protein
LFDALAATLNCTGAVAGDGAVHSIDQAFMPREAARDPARLCCTNVRTRSTAPGINCTRASSGRHDPACRPFRVPVAKRAAISNPPRRNPSRLIVTVMMYA